jgi:UDP-N-acetylglucosamine 2-epimerase (non-hydrolysing)
VATPRRIASIAGARPNFMKIAPIIAALRRRPASFESVLVHTGQHYDEKLSQVFFDELGIPRPDINLNVGSGSHAQQTAAVMAAVEPVLLEQRIDLLLVVGDVNSTIACALVAAKLGIPVAHVEAGLRSFDRRMPEEINRILTDQISDWLFTTEESALENLRREGVHPSKVHFVGNVMIDTLLAHRDRARTTAAHALIGVTPGGYALMTLHRPSNVDDTIAFERLMQGLGTVGRDVPIVFPVHPRTQPTVTRSSTAAAMVASGRLRLVEPLGYLDFVGLMERARVVLTDSGGIQEETTILGVPCLTLRENTERPVTITHGTNRLVGTDPAAIAAAWQQVKAGQVAPAVPPLWDGHAAERIAGVLEGV